MKPMKQLLLLLQALIATYVAFAGESPQISIALLGAFSEETVYLDSQLVNRQEHRVL